MDEKKRTQALSDALSLATPNTQKVVRSTDAVCSMILRMIDDFNRGYSMSPESVQQFRDKDMWKIKDLKLAHESFFLPSASL